MKIRKLLADLLWFIFDVLNAIIDILLPVAIRLELENPTPSHDYQHDVIDGDYHDQWAKFTLAQLDLALTIGIIGLISIFTIAIGMAIAM